MLGRDSCGSWDSAIRHEWLVTNGLGGFACGTVAGANTRRYHGLLMASLRPPVERTLLVAKVEATMHYLGTAYGLAANEFAGGAVDPQGFVHIESFTVDNGIPTWRYACADALLEQRIFMAPGANTTYLRLEVLRATAPVHVELKPLVTYRDYHSQGRGERPFRASAAADACVIDAFDGARPCRLAVSEGSYSPLGVWYWNFLHREETARGLDDLEDLWVPGTFVAELRVGRPLYLTATAEHTPPAPGLEVMATLVAQAQRLTAALPPSAPPWIRTLAIATNQFIVQRGDQTGAASVIAGYPWFADWGRDTMIALPGLTTALQRHEVTANVLRHFARYLDGGMLPNRFADHGEALDYNTADATLWMFHALDEHLRSHDDLRLGRELFPALMTVVHAHVAGTRYGIRVDPGDRLLHAGAPGLQLTWMDAKHGDTVFTPRAGKPVEINALWLNALDVMTRLAGRLGQGAERRLCDGLLQGAARGFERFWNAELGCLYDVLDVDATSGGAAGPDARIRPNQIMAVALPYCVLTPQRMRAVVDTCARHLLTSYGLRSLSPQAPGYAPRYVGDGYARDAAYHQGTVWTWLLGPFARAHYRVYRDAGRAQSFLTPLAQHVGDACVGSLSEIFDGDAPHTARGCFAQAWSVAEVLRSWSFLERLDPKSAGVFS